MRAGSNPTLPSGMPIRLRGEGVAPAVCYDLCNNAYTQAQWMGKIPALCDSSSLFMTSFSSCRRCLDSNGSTTEPVPPPTPTSRKDDGLLAAAPEGFVRFQQYIDYCNSLNGHLTPPQTTAVVEASVISYYTTLTTTAWIPSTLSNNSTTSYPVTVTIPIEKLPAWDGGDYRASETSTSSRASAPAANSSPESNTSGNEGTGSNIPSTTVIGVSIAVAITIVVLGALLVLWYHRRRRQRHASFSATASQTSEQSETKAQLHGESLQSHELDGGSSHGPIEMEGEKGCFELDSTMVHAELETPTTTTELPGTRFQAK